jgi:uncharacterized membrane protein
VVRGGARLLPGNISAMTTRERYFRLVAQGPELERPAFFSDAVFAIALTLLVIEIHIPDVAAAGLPGALLELVPEYLTFALSFLVIGAVWLSHHRKFRMLAAHDQTLLRLNLVLLLFVATLPLPTALLGRHGDTTIAVCVYAATIAFIGFAMAVVWTYAWRRRLTASAVTRDLYAYMLGQTLLIPGVFVVSIPVALLFGPLAGQLAWLVAFPLYMLTGRIYGRASRGPSAGHKDHHHP